MNPYDDQDDNRPLPKHGTPEWERMMAPHRAAIADMDAAHAEERAVERAEKDKHLTQEEMRHLSAGQLLRQLNLVTDLATRCQHMVPFSDADRAVPINAAARLLTASAHVATALAKVTSAESRQRAIIEHVQPVATQNPDLNSTLDASPQNGPSDLGQQAAAALDGLLFDTLQRKMLLYMNLVAAERLDPDLKKAYPEAYAPGGTLGEPSARV